MARKTGGTEDVLVGIREMYSVASLVIIAGLDLATAVPNITNTIFMSTIGALLVFYIEGYLTPQRGNAELGLKSSLFGANIFKRFLAAMLAWVIIALPFTVTGLIFSSILTLGKVTGGKPKYR